MSIAPTVTEFTIAFKSVQHNKVIEIPMQYAGIRRLFLQIVYAVFVSFGGLD
jgi:hypothetical protein